MRLLRRLTLLLIVVVCFYTMSACTANLNEPTQPNAHLDQGSVSLNPPNISTDIEKANFNEVDFTGTSLVGLRSVLDRITESQEPLTRFAAIIHDAKKISRLEYIFIIDKIELNEKYEDGSLADQPFYYNGKIEQEELTVPYDAVLILSNDIPQQIGEEFIHYVNKSFDEEGKPRYIYYFYLFGDEVGFIHDIYRP